MKYPIERLGTKPDRQLAEEWGVSHQYINQLRKKYNVPAYNWRDQLLPKCRDLLGTMSDSKLAKQFKVPVGNISTLRKELNIPAYVKPIKDIPPDVIPLLGKMSDLELQQQTGISRGSIFRCRQNLNIPCYKKHNRWNPVFKWDDEYDSMLGTMPDSHIAKKLGVGDHVVYDRRKFLGIPSFRKIKTNDQSIKLNQKT